MKWIKKIGIGFLTLILINLISLLAISYNLKKVLVNGIIKETITQKITKKDQKTENFMITEETINSITDDEKIQEILNSPEVEELMNKYLDITINSMIDENSLNQIELEKDMINFLEENKELLEQAIGQEITEEAISNTKQQLEDGDWSRSYKQTIQNASRSLTTTEKTILKGYQFFISIKFKVLMICLIIADIILIALIEKSIYQWIKQLGQSCTISGILLLCMSIGVKITVEKIAQLRNFQISSLFGTGIGLMLFGIMIWMIYNIAKKKKEKEKEYEISETLNE